MRKLISSLIAAVMISGCATHKVCREKDVEYLYTRDNFSILNEIDSSLEGKEEFEKKYAVQIREIESDKPAYKKQINHFGNNIRRETSPYAQEYRRRLSQLYLEHHSRVDEVEVDYTTNFDGGKFLEYLTCYTACGVASFGMVFAVDAASVPIALLRGKPDSAFPIWNETIPMNGGYGSHCYGYITGKENSRRVIGSQEESNKEYLYAGTTEEEQNRVAMLQRIEQQKSDTSLGIKY